MPEQAFTSSIRRRDLMKFGAAAGVGLAAEKIWPQEQRANSPAEDKSPRETGPGWVNDSHRASGNGPMDATTRHIVEYVSSFDEAHLTPELVERTNNTMIDSIAALFSGFEAEPVRIAANVARTVRSDLKSTVFGYGIVTSPEYAAYANTCMGRYTDFNDHASDMLPGIFAIGEALHCTGPQVMVASILAYQLNQALTAAIPAATRRNWDQGLTVGPATAMAVCKLMKLTQDQMANALSLTLVPNVPLRVTRSGTLSMSKGCGTAPAVRAAVFSALMAKAGMTGPAQPFEGRDGLWDKATGKFGELKLPPPEETGIGLAADMKRNPAEGWAQTLLAVSIPKVSAWTKTDQIAAIHIELPVEGWREIADPPKWDPQNHETADHSLAYDVARALLDGQIYLDSFTPEKLRDPEARALMAKITVSANLAYHFHGESRMTVRKVSGETMTFETDNPGGKFNFGPPITRAELIDKFHRVAEFIHVEKAQADRALDQWSNLSKVRDIADPIRTLAHFGRPVPLA